VGGALEHALVDRERLERGEAAASVAPHEAARGGQRARSELFQRLQDRGRAPDEDARVPQEASARDELLGARALGLLDEALHAREERALRSAALDVAEARGR